MWGNITSNALYIILYSFIFLAIYHTVAYTYRPLLILIGNIIFYLLCDWKYLVLLLFTTFWSWYAVKESCSKKRAICGCIIPLSSILLLFKYLPGITNGINQLLLSLGIQGNALILSIIMPLGLSYYIFKQISYVIDVHLHKYPAEQNFISYASYVTFFPEIISGPISRYNDYKFQLDKPDHYSSEQFSLGFYLIIKGLFLKYVIANRLVDYVNRVFDNPSAFPSLALWLAAFLFSIELYCDFSGYSSIAIGITQMLGLHYQENFKRPYLSFSIKDFWTRWHISLSSWLKDYIYIPLGGNRFGKSRQIMNTIIVFLVSGIWHGNTFNYIIWGLYHAVLTILSPKRSVSKVLGLFQVLGSFLLVTFGWIIFKINNLSNFKVYLRRLLEIQIPFSLSDIQATILPFSDDNTCIAFFLVILFYIMVLVIREIYEETSNYSNDTPAHYSWIVFLLISIIFMGQFGESSFIYANF